MALKIVELVALLSILVGAWVGQWNKELGGFACVLTPFILLAAVLFCCVATWLWLFQGPPKSDGKKGEEEAGKPQLPFTSPPRDCDV